MLGVNVGVAGPMAFFSFGDLRVHGTEAVQFYTAAKAITARWF